jgi:hypothetical protein
MADGKARRINLGDRVRILNTPGLVGRVVEFRGTLGPKGAEVYGIRLGTEKPRPYTEVLEEQLEVISPAKATPQSGE